MRLSLIGALTWIALLLVGIWQADLMAAETIVPRDHHPWGRFEIGSWKQVRIATETLDENNRVISSSTNITTTTLVDVDETSYTLHVEVVLDVAGKVFRPDPQIIKRGFNGEADGQKVVLTKIGDAVVTIDGKKIPSEIRQTVINGGNSKQVNTVYYSRQVDPYILKQDTITTDLDKTDSNYKSSVNVFAVGMPYRVKAETKSTSHVKTVHQRSNGSVVTIEVNCVEVPGGVVSHALKELSKDGQSVVRRSTLELVDYYVGDDQDGNKQNGRRRRRIKRGKLPPLVERKKR